MRRLLLPLLFLACGSSDATVAPAPDAPPTTTTTLAPAAACVKSPSPAPAPSGACPVAIPAAKDAIDDALASMQLDRCTLHMKPEHTARGMMPTTDPRAAPSFQQLLEYPLRLPTWGAETVKFFDDAMASDTPIANALAAAAQRRGGAVTECPDPALTAIDLSDDAPLASAIAYAGGDRYAAKGIIGDHVPMDLQRALAPIVRTIAWASSETRAARGKADPKELDLAPDFVMGVSTLGLTNDFVARIESFDVARVVRASVAVAAAIESAKLSRFAGADVPAIDLATPVGAIILRGKGADTHDSKEDGAALVVDTGGDDVYTGAIGAATPKRAVSIAIDLGGKDRYAYDEVPSPFDNVGMRLPSDAAGRLAGLTQSRIARQGAGFFGIGMLIDLGVANDTYRSLTTSQGAAVFGVGVLYDEGGDDTYDAEALAQGAAAWGIGLVLDRAGNDTYRGYSAVQGYGFTRGLGAVIDADGNDVYKTDPGDPAIGGDPLYPNAQLPKKGNTSMAQGCGRGERPDSPEPGFAMPGGIGILRDAHGNDSYATSVFGQASGFAMGVGMLADGGGDDTYEGLWYVQGANAHTSLSLFVDSSGNDRYDPTYPIAATSIGVGHDFSVAIHLDLGGDDHYRAPGLGLGAGNTNGVGILVNVGGSDVFEGPGPLMLGAANAAEIMTDLMRRQMPTYGLFVKAGGSAEYKVGAPTAALPGATWSTTPDRADGAAEIAAGVDRPTATAALP
jgi:hypothetical protein